MNQRSAALLPLLLALMAYLLLLALPAQAAADGAQPIQGTGLYSVTLRHGGRLREALVHVPRGFNGVRQMPLLLALHGGGGSASLMASDHYGLRAKADEAGFIAVFPNGVGALGGTNLATWNAGQCCGSARDKGIDDVGYLRSLVDHLQRRLPIDRQRIYATGMSNGGMMAHRLACDAADLLAGVAAVAGTDNTVQCTPSRPVPVLHIHALDDTHVLFNGGAGPDAFPDPSKVTDFTSVPETIQRWTQRNGCAATPRRVLTVPGAYCEVQAPCNGGARVKLCVTETGGHSWPGGSSVRRGSPSPSQAISANDVMWDFFSR